MTHKTQCKFCQRPLSLVIDDDYAKLGDPYHLMKLACCDWCAALRENHRRLFHHITRVCLSFACEPKPKDDYRQEVQDALTGLTKKYVKLVAEWHNVPGLAWEETLVANIMDKPKDYGMALQVVWKTARDLNRIQESNSLALPPSDRNE